MQIAKSDLTNVIKAGKLIKPEGDLLGASMKIRKFDNEHIAIILTDYEASYLFKIRVTQMDIKDEFIIDHVAFSRGLERIQESVTIRFNYEKEIVTFREGRKSFSLGMIENHFPDEEGLFKFDKDEAITLNIGLEDINLLDRATQNINFQNPKFELRNVGVDIKENGELGSIVASDLKSLFYREDEETPKVEGRLFTKKVIQNMVMLHKIENEYSTSGEKIKIETGEIVAVLKLGAGKYVEWKRIIPSMSVDIIIKCASLIEAIKDVRAFDAEFADMELKDNQITLIERVMNGEKREPSRSGFDCSHGENRVIRVNLKDLELSLKGVDYIPETVKIQFRAEDDEIKSININNDDINTILSTIIN